MFQPLYFSNWQRNRTVQGYTSNSRQQELNDYHGSSSSHHTHSSSSPHTVEPILAKNIKRTPMTQLVCHLFHCCRKLVLPTTYFLTKTRKPCQDSRDNRREFLMLHFLAVASGHNQSYSPPVPQNPGVDDRYSKQINEFFWQVLPLP